MSNETTTEAVTPAVIHSTPLGEAWPPRDRVLAPPLALGVGAATSATGPTLGETARALEIAAVGLSLFLFAQVLIGRLLAPEAGIGGTAVEGEATLVRLLWLPVYAIGLVAGLACGWRFVRVSAVSWLVILPAALALASVLWAIDPGTALRRGVAIAMTTVFGLYLAARFTWAELIELFAAVFAVMAIVHLLSSVLAPGFGVHDTIHPGAWRGGAPEKNTMGSQMARAAVLAVCAGLFAPQRRAFWLGFAALAAGLVLMSTSKTALVALVLGLGTTLGVRLLRQGPAMALGLVYLSVAGVAAIAILGVAAPEALFAVLGRDATLTGRTDIWTALADRIAERPWLGYGYDVFWSDPLGPRVWVWEATQWNVPTAHNGWLEVALSLGLVGVGFCAVLYATVLLLALGRLGRGREAYPVLALLVIFTLLTVSESALLQRNDLSWVMFVAFAAKLFVGERDGDPAGGPAPRR